MSENIGLTYVASPYSHPNPEIREWRFKTICLIVAGLMKYRKMKGLFSPIAHSHPIAVAGCMGGDIEQWMELDMALLQVCKKFLLVPLPGWSNSRGMRVEIDFMVEHRPEVSIEKLEDWKELLL
jgi:hypothetical protein